MSPAASGKGDGLGEHLFGAHRDPDEQLGLARPGRDQVVAAVKGRAEDDVDLVEQGEGVTVAGRWEVRGVGADDRDPLGAGREQVGQAGGQAFAEVVAPLAQQAEPGAGGPAAAAPPPA